MKKAKTILALALLCMATTVNATVRTVSNNTNSPGQYTSILAAINASSTSVVDTVYVHGSPYGYGDIGVNRAVVIIGPGHKPNKQNPLVASFGQIYIHPGTSNVKLIGLSIGFINTSNSGVSTGINVQRCYMSHINWEQSAPASWIVEGCIFYGSGANIYAYGASPSSNTFRNNIFNGFFQYYNSGAGTTFILHNLFLHPNGSGAQAFNNGVSSCEIDNNLFVGINAMGTDNTSCMVNNYVAAGTNGSFSSDCGGNGYYPNVSDLQFVNNGGGYFDYNNDYHLLTTSIAHNTGTDFTDRGIYGGNTNIFSMTGEPAIPEITVFTVSPASISPGGTINVNVTSVRKQ